MNSPQVLTCSDTTVSKSDSAAAASSTVQPDSAVMGNLMSELAIQCTQHLANAIAARTTELTKRLDLITECLAVTTRQNSELQQEIQRVTKTAGIQANQVEHLRVMYENFEKQVENLHENTVQRHIRKPLLYKLVHIYSQLTHLEQGDIRRKLAFLCGDIKDFLVCEGAELIEPAPGMNFVPTEHKPISVEEAVRPEDDGTVSRCFRCGLKLNGRMHEPAWVAVFRWKDQNLPDDQKTFGQPK